MKAKNTFLPHTFLSDPPTVSINIGGKLLSIDKPLIMGILNITPDSFYTGSRLPDEKDYLSKAEQMLSEGATFLDIGGQSTRPKARLLSAAEEIGRVLPAIKKILKRFPEAHLSIDTYHAEVAKAAVEEGAVIVNDISAGQMDPAMIPTVAGLGIPYIAMHMQRTPATMQENPHYEDVVQEILDFFIQKSEECKAAGIHDLIIDPGFGFGKSIKHNYTVLRHLSAFHILGIPILAGLSRKSMIYRLLDTDSAQALNGTTALNMLALLQGANILRVHDVKPAMETIRIWEFYHQQS